MFYSSTTFSFAAFRKANGHYTREAATALAFMKALDPIHAAQVRTLEWCRPYATVLRHSVSSSNVAADMKEVKDLRAELRGAKDMVDKIQALAPKCSISVGVCIWTSDDDDVLSTELSNES